MANLMNKKTQTILFDQLEVADNFWARSKGLLGRRELSFHQALWIHRCNSIHTFFMKFPIDCVFVDRNLKVRKVLHDIKPGRLVLPVWGASSVIEMGAGVATQIQIKVGDELHVGT